MRWKVDIEPLGFEHKELITRLCKDLSIPLSEYNFANLYLFRALHKYALLPLEGSRYAIRGVSYTGLPFFMPLFHPDNWSSSIAIAKEYEVQYIFPIPEQWFTDLQGDGYTVDVSESDSDYLFEKEAIKTFQGRAHDGHRNLVRNFASDHTITVEKLCSSNRSKALFVIDGWAKDRRAESQQYELEACKESVALADLLGLEGWVYTVDQTPSGLLIGGPLTSSMYIYHFSKTTLQYRGLPTYMHQDAAGRIGQQYTVLNWEQDLGIEGLRKAKRSYHPIALAKKGKLRL